MHIDRAELPPGQRLARGVSRHLRDSGFAALTEMTLSTGQRVDVIAVGARGEIWVVECKSSRAEFISDGKWRGYLDWCDRFFWAVGPDFPVDILPSDAGLMFADGWDAHIERMPEERRLAPARRKALTLQVARLAATRLMAVREAGVMSAS